jgi:RNA recognition motif-containing protein
MLRGLKNMPSGHVLGWWAHCPLHVADVSTPENGAVTRREVPSMAKKLFVGSLSWNTNDDGLRRAFSPFGEVTEVKVIADRDTGRSRGFGFVTFDDDEAATKAIAALDGTELDGRTIKVNVAQDKERGGGGRGGYGGGGRDRW